MVGLVVIVLLLGYLFFIKNREGMDSPQDMAEAIALTQGNVLPNQIIPKSIDLTGLSNQVGPSASTTSLNPLINFAMNAANTKPTNMGSSAYVHAVPSIIPSGLPTSPIVQTPNSAIITQTRDMVQQLKQNINSNSSVIKNAFHPVTGQLNDDAILPIKNSMNMILSNLKTNLTSNNMHQMLDHVVDLATTLKQNLPPPTQTTKTTSK
jgi:hypothetical protein